MADNGGDVVKGGDAYVDLRALMEEDVVFRPSNSVYTQALQWH